MPVVVFAEEPQFIVGKDGAKMALVPAGTFHMGGEDDDIKETAPWHEVYLGDFYIDVYEVTNELFVKFLNDVRPFEGMGGKRWNWLVIRNDLELRERYTWWPAEIIYENKKYVALEGNKSHPVITVSWHAADEYCKWAEKRLPTEAEWEKAARGGLKKARFPWGDEIPTGGVVFDRVWRDNMVPAPTGAIGNYYPNGYGLYDMAGNVWEWVSDWFDPSYYSNSPDENPQGPKSGELKVLRGGAWHNFAMGLRVSVRNTELPMSTGDGVGFRCAIDASDAVGLSSSDNNLRSGEIGE